MGASIPHGAGYRPEIDGLRAVAVASVVAYHINKGWLPGGYVGVDIFFVISGFLITSIIWRELQGGTFTLVDFYLRRIRRIIPVMLVVVAVTVLAGVFLLLPEALERLSLSAIFSVASAANIYFWLHLDDDYFAEASDQEPLLHLWSLGVEEQFYMVWPLLLLAVAALRKNRTALALVAASVIAIASFAVAEATNESNPKFSYFMLPARAGELMVGALLALALQRAHSQRWLAMPLAAELLGVAGLAVIGYALFFLDDLSPFPGTNALYPCIGAALVILAGAHSRVLKWLLASRPMVWIGLISYSLYLWHWPILAFIRYFYGMVSATHAAIAVLAMLALAVLSYRFVERPTRRVRWSTVRQTGLLFLLPAACVVIPAFAIAESGGLKAWIESSPAYQQGLARLEASTAPAYRFEYNCQLARHDPDILRKERCVIGATDPRPGAPRILLWGDSHAAHHVGAIGAMAASAGIQVRNATHSSCPPVFGREYGHGKYKRGCTPFREYIRRHINSGEFDVVLMGATWSSYQRQSGFKEDIARTIAEIRRTGTSVVLLGRVPYFASYNRECDMRWLRVGSSGCDRVTTGQKPLEINDYLKSFARAGSGVTYLNLGEAICDDATCRAHLDGKPLYYDKSHLSMDGSRRLGEHMVASGTSAAWVGAMAREGSRKSQGISGVRDQLTHGESFEPAKLTIDLPESLELPFRYHRRFDNGTVGFKGSPAERRVMVEYLGVGPAEVERKMVRALDEKGFSTSARSQRNGVQMIELSRPDGSSVILKITLRMSATAEAPDAVGTLHMTWRGNE
ncbi:acyltransferase family protein [Luteimonas viscosa]|uniref:acyltransferase family protein n=1 Tax=Luteimonas viscosa TaxID=1132694 RepID=UPI001654156F|nr:acyltransferase family protein [Luteimonas viscosa]